MKKQDIIALSIILANALNATDSDVIIDHAEVSKAYSVALKDIYKS